jgi:hypothetical protein
MKNSLQGRDAETSLIFISPRFRSMTIMEASDLCHPELVSGSHWGGGR